MINISDLISVARWEGYKGTYAQAKVCQDIILKAIAKSSLNRNVTIKGGVVMRNVTGDLRRATMDIDLDFIKYSLTDEAIHRFVSNINCVDGITIEIKGNIEELSQNEYKGKRAYLYITDIYGNQINSKVDFGVHVDTDIEQEEYCFDVCLDNEGACLLMNSKEQIFTEKLKSLLRFGSFSTRYKDVFDMYYLSKIIIEDKLIKCIDKYIINDSKMKENSINEIYNRTKTIFNNNVYMHNITQASKSNWLNMNIQDVLSELLDYLKNIKNENI